MTPELISAILTGLAGVLTAAGGIYTVRRKSSDADTAANFNELKSLRKATDKFRRKELLFLNWTHRMQVVAAEKGLSLPDMPDELRRLLASQGEESGETGPFPTQK